MTPAELAKSIDHTLLRADATVADLNRLCEEAGRYNFATVCVNPCYIELAVDLLKGTPVKVCTVVSFPLGADSTSTKVHAAVDAVRRGAKEVDFVISLGAAKSGQLDFVKDDIRSVVDAVKREEIELGHNLVVKAIIETGALTDEQKATIARIVELAGADFVKTSTGFGPGGATVEDVKLLRGIVSPEMGIKASGGIRSLNQALSLLAAGANRLGTSSGAAIIEEMISGRKEAAS
ncbi:MAG: deoxyribose-phosphate aldolase [Actinobacteria bacterium]|nr:deoxyribose-phosphate aldolase [Actinomycetota bacterium]